jgi:hypothetical protein
MKKLSTAADQKCFRAEADDRFGLGRSIKLVLRVDAAGVPCWMLKRHADLCSIGPHPDV